MEIMKILLEKKKRLYFLNNDNLVEQGSINFKVVRLHFQFS